MNASSHDHNRFAVIKIVVIYAFVGMLWIYFSDTILGWMTHDPVLIKYIAISKGILFVIITASLLYILIHRHTNRLMKVNQMLQERELLLQSTAINIPGAMCQFYVSDAGDYGVSYVSVRVKDIFGLSTDLDSFFPSFTNHVMEEDRNRFLESIKEAVSTGLPWKFEGRFIKSDGELLWFQGMSTQQRVKERLLFYSVLLDITDRKNSLEVLRESEKKYRDLFDFLPIPVYEMDFEANITSANRAIYETFRGTDEDLKKGFKAWQILSPEEVHKSAENIQRLLKGEQIGGTEYTLMRLDGSVFSAMVISSVIYNDGKPVGLRGAIVDITQRRKQEEELRRMNIFLTSIVENIPVMIFLKDSVELRFVLFNRAGEDLLGYSREELLGKSDYDFFSKDQADLFTKKDRKVLLGKEVVDIAEESIQTRNKGERILHTKKVPILDANGEPEYLLGISDDITESMQTREALWESEEKYRLVVENAKESIFITQDMKVVFVNHAAINMVGYSEETILTSKSFTDFIHPDDLNMVVDNHIKRIKGEEVPPVYAFRVIDQDRNVIWGEINATVIPWKGKTATLNFLNDITVRKKSEDELQRTLESLRKSFGATVQVMVSAIESRDPYTAGHQLRVADLARAVATEMGLSQEKIEGIRMAGSIHDIGKLSIPSEILSKPTKLTDLEFSLVKEHSQKGYDILKDVESPWPLAQIVYQHHERMDGSGYPRNLKGDEILLEARIMAVADVVEAMASHRPYRPGLGIEAALEEIENNKGIFYDNDVADACLRLFREKGYQLK